MHKMLHTLFKNISVYLEIKIFGKGDKQPRLFIFNDDDLLNKNGRIYFYAKFDERC